MYDEMRDTGEIQDEFRSHLREAAEEVNTWPSWKQSVLGKAVGLSEPTTSSPMARECGADNNNPHNDHKV